MAETRASDNEIRNSLLESNPNVIFLAAANRLMNDNRMSERDTSFIALGLRLEF